MATETQIAANRKNPLLSTGPRTPGGKDRSRRNALKHGLCSSVVLPEDAELVTRRISEFFEALNRRCEAERLGARLAGSPGEVSEALRRTLHGCDWLVSQWALSRRSWSRASRRGWPRPSPAERPAAASSNASAPEPGEGGSIGDGGFFDPRGSRGRSPLRPVQRRRSR